MMMMMMMMIIMYMYRENREKGAFQDANEYLDVHFRLLREEYIRPLREGMQAYKEMKESRASKPADSRKEALE
jgi:hypothetical protein